MALPLVIFSQNGNTTDAKDPTSNTTNNSASSSVSTVKKTYQHLKRRIHKENEKQNLRSNLHRIKIWKKPKIKNAFSQQQQNEQPAVSLIGTRAEDRIIVTTKKKSPANNGE